MKHRTIVTFKLLITAFFAALLFSYVTFSPDTLGYAQQDGREIALKSSVKVLVDDFIPQPLRGDATYFYNRLGGDRGATGDTLLEWGKGIVTATVRSGSSGGFSMNLNHPQKEGGVIDFSAILPKQIRSKYQSKITAIAVSVAGAKPGGTLKLELKDARGKTKKVFVARLHGEAQELNFDLAEDLSELTHISQLALIMDNATPGDHFAIRQIAFTATNPIKDPALAGFVWSYGMLLNNWNPDTGLVRDKSRDASGEIDAVQATGSLAAATAVAYQLDIVSRKSAIRIVRKISTALLNHLPRHEGLWPHWVTGPSMEILRGEEWSSVDSAIALLGLMESQIVFGLDTSDTKAMLKAVNWENLRKPKGISHGYSYDKKLLPYVWDTFGGESWFVELVYVMGSDNSPTRLAFPLPPTANGSGFIDELAWLFVPPPQSPDYWGVNWTKWRKNAVADQINYYPNQSPASCFAALGLFGLSAAEVPAPWTVDKKQIYQSFGLGGRHKGPNDGSELLGATVVAPHYSAMIASLCPQEARTMWAWLINEGLFSPLNNVESLMFTNASDCKVSDLSWNELKGSWNLALQTLGWGRYLAKERGQVPILWQTAKKNKLLCEAHETLSRKR